MSREPGDLPSPQLKPGRGVSEGWNGLQNLRWQRILWWLFRFSRPVLGLVLRPELAMATHAHQSDRSHRIAVCTTCRPVRTAYAPGWELIRQLRTALASAVGGVAQRFSVCGIACMAGCARPCTVAFQAYGKAAYLFGDIDPADDIDALVAFAQLYETSAHGWTRSGERPSALAGKTLARVPALSSLANADGEIVP